MGGVQDTLPQTAKGMRGHQTDSMNDDLVGANSQPRLGHATNSAGAASQVMAKRDLQSTKKSVDTGNQQTEKPASGYDREFEDEFERMYKKEVDKFIDGSNFEVESLSGFSELSGGVPGGNIGPRTTKAGGTKDMEAEYLRKLEQQKAQHTAIKSNRSGGGSTKNARKPAVRKNK